MFCKNCGNELSDIQAICLKCGVEKGKGNSFCHSCGNPVEPAASVCLNCGVAINGAAPKAAPAASGNDLNGKDKISMALICFFLGGLGIHNFMMGENKKGLVKIVLSLLCGLGGILALVDFVKILTDSYKYDPNAAF